MKQQQRSLPEGTLEMYVLGALSDPQAHEVDALVALNEDLRKELLELQELMGKLVQKSAQQAPKGVKARIMAAIVAVEKDRTKAERPPIIHPASRIADYQQWIDDPSMVPPADREDVFFIPFAQNEDGMSAIAWLRTGSPLETHTDVIEKFLILEGECEIHMRGEVHPLRPGSTFNIPLHIPHELIVTSKTPCKAIVQRIAA